MASLPRIRLLLPCPKSRPGNEWGDLYFGQSLKAALERAGQRVVMQFAVRHRRLPDWRRMLAGTGEVDLILRGKHAHAPRAGRPCFMWLISQPDTLTDDELAGVSHVFVASEPFAAALRARGHSASTLLQCTDPAIFTLSEAAPSGSLLFVGNRRQGFPRRVVEMAQATGHPVEVWGRGWSDALPPGSHRGTHIPNAELGHHYARAGAVLNDHAEAMRAHGFVSNRVYDVLCCGRPVITEAMPGLAPDIAGMVYTYTEAGSLADAVAAALNEGPERLAARRAFASHVAAAHSFDARAAEIISVMAERLGQQADRASAQDASGPGQRRALSCPA